MFNTNHMDIGGISTSVNINAVGGTLTKSDTRSQIIRFHMDSPMAKEVFSTTNPRLDAGGNYNNEFKSIIVLQVMLCGGNQFLVEFMFVEKEQKK